MIKCIALDLDNTTLDSKGHLSEKNRLAIETAIENGIHIVIATGRAYDSLPEEITSIPGIEYAITSNGAAIYDIKHRRRIHNYYISPSAVEDILLLTSKYNVTYETFISGTAYALQDYVKNPVKYGASQVAVPYITSTRNPVSDIVEYIRTHSDVLDSIDIIVKDLEQKEIIINELHNNIDSIYITTSAANLIEISDKSSGKRSGLEYILNHLNIDQSESCAFGDGDNDADVLAYAHIGIAMENASSKCLENCNYITLNHNDNGIYHAFANILCII